MNRITPLIDLDNFTVIAKDLSDLLKRPDNVDIAGEFPGTVTRYGGAAIEAAANLEEARDLYKTGSREQFIVFSGQKAVGICLIVNQLDITPKGINPAAPNISGFVANPFRNQGVGRTSIEQRMEVVKSNFDNRAWTFVRDDNHKSEHLVMDVGFEKSDRAVEGWEGHHLYLYGDTET